MRTQIRFDAVPVVNTDFGLGGVRCTEMIQSVEILKWKYINVIRPHQALGTKIQGRKGEIRGPSFSVQLSLSVIYSE